MKLPASLQPWATILQAFPPEISLILGEYAREIAPFFGALNADDAESGEPNGYDGVARRGIYERLLLSEFALADEFPDEFVRRAAMGEHLFLNLAKQTLGSKRATIAVFDAGALQLGTARIAHLAILIVLARRAQSAGAKFLWGVFHERKQLIISDDTVASIQILLESRTASAVSQDDLTEWRERLSDVPDKSDVWLIGSESLARFAETKDFSGVFVDEVLELDKSELTLKIKGASRIEKQITLQLPAANLCTRLLRNPFETAKTFQFSEKQLGGAITNLFFDQKGARLFAKLDSKAVLSFPIQNTVGADKIYPSVYRPNGSEKFVAAGSLRKAIAVLSIHDHQTLRLNYRKNGFALKEGLYGVDKAEFGAPEDEAGLLQMFSLRPKNFVYEEAAVLDANRNLFVLSEGNSGENAEHLTGIARVTATDVLAVAQTDKEFVFVGREAGDESHKIVSISDKVERRDIPANRVIRAIFGRGEAGKRILAIESYQLGWTILGDADDAAPQHFEPRATSTVVGVYHDSRFAPSAGWFELTQDRRTLEFAWGANRRRNVLTAADEIVKIEFSPRSPVLAYQTKGGELVIYSLTHRAAIGRYSE